MRFVDITGQTFGDLYVQKYLGDRKYLCLCKRCGKTEEVVAQQLKNGNRTMCKDCRKIVDHEKKVNSRLIDITGQTFGEWHVDYFVGDRLWHCTCSCGTERLIKGPALTHGRTQHCDNAIHTVIDLTGKTFGDWHVDSFAGNHSWNCTCSCGKKSVVDGYQLRSGRSTSCGHATTGFKDLTGQTIGDLKVVQYVGDHKWNCICKCGLPRVVDSWTLRTNVDKFGFYRCNHKIAIGMRSGKLVVTKINADGTIVCHCDCGKDIVLQRRQMQSGHNKSCGCLRENVKSREDVLKAIKQFKDRTGVDPFAEDLANELEMGMTATYRYLDDYGLRYLMDRTYGSRGEAELASLYPGQTAHVRNILGDDRELDLYYPDRKIALEYNGSFWHSADRKAENYHQTKQLLCANKNIHLVQVFSYEWNNADTKKKIIDYLNSLMYPEKLTRVYARDVIVDDMIDQQEAYEFERLYHIQNKAVSSINIGLRDKDSHELLQLMTFGRPRFNSNYQYELIRYVNKSELAIVGGAEKMFSHFVKSYDPKQIISYCDLQKFTGKVYDRLGFKLDGITKPNYKWVSRDEKDVLSRYETQKKNLADFGYDIDSMTEDDIMTLRGYFKVYDCGNLRFIWSPQTEL